MFTGNLPVYETVNRLINSFSTQTVEDRVPFIAHRLLVGFPCRFTLYQKSVSA
jgi:hypothetical protein